MPSPGFSRTAALVGLVALSTTTHAQPAPEFAAEDDIQTIGGVAVTGSRISSGFDNKLTDAPASISVITQEELRKRPYVTLADAVSELDGVDVGESASGSGQKSISIRGMGADYTVILVDGKRQDNNGDLYPNFVLTDSQFGYIPPLDAIERIEVIRGPASVVYGVDSLGGVINIITKKVSPAWTGSTSLGYTAQQDNRYGDVKTVDFSLRGPLIRNVLGLSLRGSFSKVGASYADGADIVDPAGTLHPYEGRNQSFSGRENTTLGAGLALQISEQHTLRMELDSYRQDYDRESGGDSFRSVWRTNAAGRVNPGIGWKPDQKISRDGASITHDGKWDFGESMLSLSWVENDNKGRTMPFGPAERRLLQAMYDATGMYAGMSETERRALAETTFFPRPDRPFKSSQYTLDAKMGIPLGDGNTENQLTIGGQMVNGAFMDGAYGMESDSPSNRLRQKQKTRALFAEHNLGVTEKLVLTSGVRYDWHNLFAGHFSPRVYANYDLSPQFVLKGGISFGYKTPKITDLYNGVTGFGGNGTRPWAGNPNLKPESSLNSEIALYWNHPNQHSFNITLFRNDFKDKIQSVEARSCRDTGGIPPCVNLGGYDEFGTGIYNQEQNVGKALVQGVEIAGRVHLGPHWAIRGNYTHTDSEIKRGVNQGKQLTMTARNMFNSRVEWHPTESFGMFLSGEYRAKRYRGDRNQEYYKGYSLVHLGAHYTISPNISVNARINNLLDRDFTAYRVLFESDGRGGYIPDTYLYDYYNRDNGRSFWLGVNVLF